MSWVIIDREDLKREVEALRSQGKTIVFANGAFDLLHVGHVRFLNGAALQGDVLIVGLNTDESIRQHQVVAFLRHLRAHLRGPIIVVWDRLGAHRGAQIRAYLQQHPRLTVELLPPYAPELNPNEYGWSYLKYGQLANFCPRDLDQLERKVFVAAIGAQTQQALLRSFVHATKLPIRL